MKDIMQKIKIGSKWKSGDRTFFIVQDVIENNQGIWIYYSNPNSGMNYNCLIEAFLQRFSEDVNS
jgi:hypothetical protein